MLWLFQDWGKKQHLKKHDVCSKITKIEWILNAKDIEHLKKKIKIFHFLLEPSKCLKKQVIIAHILKMRKHGFFFIKTNNIMQKQGQR